MVFPKNEHLKIAMYLNAMLGVWPFIFENNPVLRKIYDIYANCTFYCYLLSIITSIIQLIIIVSDEVLDVGEIMANLCITLLNFITILRVKATKTERVKNMIRKVLLVEEDVLNSDDEKIIKIYSSYTYQNKIYNKIFLVNVYLVDVLYFVQPLYADDAIKYYPERNETVVIKALPLSSWFPFNQQKHYVLTYLWQVTDILLATTFISCSDILAFSLIIFALSQIKILKLILTNFQEYSARVQNQLQCSKQEASFITIRECIMKHQEIIAYVKEYNLVMRNIMVFDFLLSSVQLASLALTLLVTEEVTLFNTACSGQFALSMFVKLLMYYWYANELTVHGSEIGTALCRSMWYEESQRVQKMMIYMIMRCNKDLYLEIGPFTVMTLKTFLGILKATYSYVTLIYR